MGEKRAKAGRLQNKAFARMNMFSFVVTDYKL